MKAELSYIKEVMIKHMSTIWSFTNRKGKIINNKSKQIIIINLMFGI